MSTLGILISVFDKKKKILRLLVGFAGLFVLLVFGTKFCGISRIVYPLPPEPTSWEETLDYVNFYLLSAFIISVHLINWPCG